MGQGYWMMQPVFCESGSGRIRNFSPDPDPELFVLDQDPARMKKQININILFIISGLWILDCSIVFVFSVWNIKLADSWCILHFDWSYATFYNFQICWVGFESGSKLWKVVAGSRSPSGMNHSGCKHWKQQYPVTLPEKDVELCRWLTGAACAAATAPPV